MGLKRIYHNIITFIIFLFSRIKSFHYFTKHCMKDGVKDFNELKEELSEYPTIKKYLKL